MRAKKTRWTLLVLTLMVGAAAAGWASPGEKVAVCHRDIDLNALIRIEVSPNAVPAHLAHGDALAGTAGLDDNCLPLGCVVNPDAVTWPGNGHAYEVVNTATFIPWAEAAIAAEAAGGHLVTLAAGEENDFVYALVAATYTGPTSPWLGGYQPPGSVEPDGGWSWVTGEPFAFTAWTAGEPNDAGGEHALIFWGGPVWNDWADWRGELTGLVIEWEIPACAPAE